MNVDGGLKFSGGNVKMWRCKTSGGPVCVSGYGEGCLRKAALLFSIIVSVVFSENGEKCSRHYIAT